MTIKLTGISTFRTLQPISHHVWTLIHHSSRLMGTLPQQQPKNVPAFLDDLHRSLHSAYRTVRSHIQSAHQCNKQRYDKQRPYTSFMVGNQVWLHVPVVKPGRTKKFTSQWRGPYTVMDSQYSQLPH